MNEKYRKMKNLFLRQSCLDSWEDYERSLNKNNFLVWDYLIITASNEEQAENYREQIRYRLSQGLLPGRTHYAVLSDPEGKRVGSGGATFNVLKYIREQEPEAVNPFEERRILVIHSGGDSRRVPQYSASGKLFASVPRELPNGHGSTLFDEFVIGMSGVPSRIKDGMLVLSGDVLLLFNPLQIDSLFHGAAAISIKEPVDIGKDHGVFLNNGQNYVKSFLHKQTEESLRTMGAVNEQGYVDLDTGAILFDSDLLMALLGLITTENKIDNKKFREFVNERARVSFYGDFLYPLAESSTLENYYKEKPEGEDTEELWECRKKIWEVLHDFSLKLICLSPAEFIHFGTTWELLQLVTRDVEDYEFLDWKKQVLSTSAEGNYAAHNSYIGKKVHTGKECYLENSFILGNSVTGDHSILSCVYLRDTEVPGNTVMHGLILKGQKHIVRIYGVHDNPKEIFAPGHTFLGGDAGIFLRAAEKKDILEELQDFPENTSDDKEKSAFQKDENMFRNIDGKPLTLWEAPIYPVCESRYEAVQMALTVYRMAKGTASEEEIRKWRQSPKMSLCQSFNEADMSSMYEWLRELENRILSSRFIWALEAGVYYQNALKLLGSRGITEPVYQNLIHDIQDAEPSLKIRAYYALSRFMKHEKKAFDSLRYDTYEAKCFQTIAEAVQKYAFTVIPDSSSCRIAETKVKVELPVRVNWGGGWTDTPPYCLENGGLVLNAAITLKGRYPVKVCVRRLERPVIEFASEDVGAFGKVTDLRDILDCHNPYDPFALHKAALIACGVISIETKESLEEILTRLGGGIYLSTQVEGVPKGSGLGTSSILSGAAVKAIFRFLGIEKEEQDIFAVVSCMEQIMSTGGGWQDQVGGLTPGVKLLRTSPGIEQKIERIPLKIAPETKQELQERFALIYTGQRRLARNLLRDVVGGYVGGRPESVAALKDMQPLAVLMKYQLEKGDIDEFAKLLNRHWELSKQLDSGCTNTCIDQIFLACEDLIDGKFIAGAGGGGFLQVVLKKGVTKEELSRRLHGVFQDSGVDVWESEIVWG